LTAPIGHAARMVPHSSGKGLKKWLRRVIF